MLKESVSRLFSSWLFSSLPGRLLLLILMGLMAYLSIYAGSTMMKVLFKPGPVSAMHASSDETLGGYHSHAEFEKECGHCHAPIHCITPERCQECHYEVAQQRSESVGLHGILPGTARCATCHVEHRGREAVIVEVALENIDHATLTGYDLDQHAAKNENDDLVCADCHQEGELAAEAVDCRECHQDKDPQFLAEHNEQFGDGCLECHDGRDRMAYFDHNAVYPQDGGHAGLECSECHVDQTYAGTPSDCASCHPDPELHKGTFGLNCARCHSAVAWAPAQFIQHSFIVDNCPEGEVIDCETCHVETYTEYPCYSCHEHEEMENVHQGWEIEAVDDCIECHPTGPGERAQQIAVDRAAGTGAGQ